MRYALIVDGKIDNIIHLEERNVSDFPNAVFCEEYPVSEGDDYVDGKFYKDGKEVLTYQAQYNKDLRTLAEGLEALKEYKENLIILNEYIVQAEMEKAMASLEEGSI